MTDQRAPNQVRRRADVRDDPGVDPDKTDVLEDDKRRAQAAARQSPPAPAVRDGYIATNSGRPYHAVRSALALGEFKVRDGTLWPTAPLERWNAQGYAQLIPRQVDAAQPTSSPRLKALVESMQQQVSELSDLDADVLDALTAIWINQAKRPTDSAEANVDMILAMRGVQRKLSGGGRRGGYEPEQREAIQQALARIESVWIRMAEMEIVEPNRTGGRRGRKKKVQLQSRAIVVTDRVMVSDSPAAPAMLRQFKFRPGEVFAQFLQVLGRQVAQLSVRVLHYDPYRRSVEKRLARYLSWLWRIRATEGPGTQSFRVGTLLDQAGLMLGPQRPSVTKLRLEAALDRLEKDRVIAGWQYEGWDEDHADHRGWAEMWKSSTIRVEPPAKIKEHYKMLGASRRTRVTDDRAETGARLSVARRKAGLTQMQLAEDLGMHPGQIEALELGQPPAPGLRRPQMARLKAWLRQHLGQTVTPGRPPPSDQDVGVIADESRGYL